MAIIAETLGISPIRFVDGILASDKPLTKSLPVREKLSQIVNLFSMFEKSLTINSVNNSRCADGVLTLIRLYQSDGIVKMTEFIFKPDGPLSMGWMRIILTKKSDKNMLIINYLTINSVDIYP